MKVLRDPAAVRDHTTRLRARGATVGLVPTMGAFHAGHEALMRAGRECDEVVVSLFVNPTQFNDPADFAGYPRVEDADAAIARRAGAHVLFAPRTEDMYPSGFATGVSVRGLSDVLEGEHRPGHFEGVCTIVAKLLSIVDPDVAYFGQKDAQQVVIVRRMAADLDFRARIRVVPTVREPDGLAMSSRNRRLSAQQRHDAAALPRALGAAERAIASGERDPARIRAQALASAGTSVRFEYLAIVEPRTLAQMASVAQPVLVAAAAWVGPVRLIDNIIAIPPSPPPAAPAEGTSAKEDF